MSEANNQQATQYKIDIVFCIDSTGSMSPIIDQVKDHAKNLHKKIIEAFQAGNRPIGQLRIKIIPFADYATEADEAIVESPFFNLPAEVDMLNDAIDAICIDKKGGDIPENAFEAVWKAIQSDWVPIASNEKGRHIIVVLTDAYPLNFQERATCIGYANENYPESLSEMQDVWEESDNTNMGKSSQLSGRYSRLVLFAPSGADEAGHTWDDVSGWKQTTLTVVDPAKGLEDASLASVIDEIFKSVG